MQIDDKKKRLGSLQQIPLIAGADHRFYLDEQGNDRRLYSLSRKERRRLKVQTNHIVSKYREILKSINASGAGYPSDKLLRELAFEYTHRYASSGIHNQPTSFNYFEPFCDIRLIKGSAAPYAYPVAELDHLFSVVDYIDFITSSQGERFNLSQLRNLPDGKAYHFTSNADFSDLTFLSAEGREFIIGGFSLVRRATSLNWYLVGGEIHSDTEWRDLVDNQVEIELDRITPWKKPFLLEAIERNGSRTGAPLEFEGVPQSLKTIIAGETDLISHKHLGRCHTTEWQNVFTSFCDDPEMFAHLVDEGERARRLKEAYERVEGANVMWNLAEAMFQLPMYFEYKVSVSHQVPVMEGKRLARVPRGGQGPRGQFRYVSSIEASNVPNAPVRSYNGPTYKVETEGHWRRLQGDKYGSDVNGNAVRGKIWVKAVSKWRERPDKPRTIYIKSSISAARDKVADYLARANLATAESSSGSGVLYTLRCAMMRDQVYKVGWTSGSAHERAKELSSATGVPSSFIVVDCWPHPNPVAVERAVHAVRRQNIWRRPELRLAEGRPRLGFDVRRRACGAASVDVRWSVV